YDKRPKLNEPKILNSYQIPNLYKTIDTKKYDILNLNRYISALFNYNDSAHQDFYQKKIDYLLSEIKKDRYNFDVYIDGYLKTGEDVATNNGNNTNVNTNTKYTNTGVAINANKLLYDGQYRLINHVYNILDKRLADIKELNAKERLIILGTSIYTNMYISQEELTIFKKILKKQEFIKKIVDERYKQGKDSILDYINSQTDLINLKRAILDLRYKYLHNDYILRHSIKSRSEKPFLLFPAKIHLNMESLVRLQKEAIKQNSAVAIESNILKIKQTDLLSQRRRYYPKINFNSYLGYGLSKDDIFNLSGAGRGAYWGIGLTFKIPIYERDDIRLNKERQRYNILKQNSIFSAKQRDVLIQVEKSYNEVIRIKKQKQFLEELLTLNDKKMKIMQEKYISGISPYKDYSNGIKDFLNYKNQLIQMKQDYIKEMSILSILVGKRKFYEQN
ncbi:MAG: TolC family protein, partial [Epsilonproteobacteria bacterium]|nr:TolC family protein [Campylobacterota bacterium]